MSDSSVQNDTLKLEFFSPSTNTLLGELLVGMGVSASFNNYTQVNFEKDFFTPSNGLTVILEDDRIYQLTAFLQRGVKVKVSINGNPNMVGYIFDYNLAYSRNGGTQLTLQCKDLLEYMAQGTVYPNMGTNKDVNFHFQPTDTLTFALQTIFTSFAVAATGDQSVVISVDNAGDLTFATGFRVGLASKGKTPKSRQKSLSSTLNHLTMPQKGESYLAYVLRLIKHAGCNIKMSNSSENTVIVKPPTYDRETASPYKLVHYLNPPKNADNNVLSGHFKFSLDKQPSVVIVEANSNGDGKFYQSTLKGIAVNELTGYNYKAYAKGGGGSAPAPIPTVTNAVAQLTNGNLGSGYVLAPFNKQLFDQRADLAIDIDTEVSMPFYTVDYNAHTKEEVSFAASKILAEHQDKYVEFKYVVQGWTMAGTNFVWQPDMMVEITEEIFRPGGTAYVKIPMWIRKVNFLKSRNGGTETEIVCTLPYTHNFEITK
jgi:hypothetical protein